METVYLLLEKYFSGNTSAEEERALYRYFSQEDLPEDLRQLAPIFVYLKNESEALAVLNKTDCYAARANPRRLRRLTWTVAALVAAMLTGIVVLNLPPKRSGRYAENCVWINGKRVTSPEIVRQYAEQSFGNVKPVENIVEQQLNFVLE